MRAETANIFYFGVLVININQLKHFFLMFILVNATEFTDNLFVSLWVSDSFNINLEL